MNINFNLKSPAELAPNKTVGQFFEALKVGIFSSQAVKAPDGIFFQNVWINSIAREMFLILMML